MPDTLPPFKYHPDPIGTGSIEASPAECDCCGQARGYIYVGSFYAAGRETPKLCPWCIASGDAAEKYEGEFSDDYPLQDAELDEAIVREVCERTPGYVSWQQEVWLSHCRDACEFHGDAEPDELRALSEDVLADLLAVNGINAEHWPALLESYRKGGDPSVYKFVCRHCGTPRYGLDFT